MKTKKKETVSLHKLETLFAKHSTSQAPLFKQTIPSFYILLEPSAEYIKPTFSAEASPTCFRQDKLPKVLLISAAGATGKSELTKYLTSTLKMPVFDLGSHDPVGSNSLTGLFYYTMGGTEFANYIEKLKKGEATILIDALDEGHMKTTVAAFDSFLDGIVDIAKDAKSTPFILLGRTNIIESTYLYLMDKNIETEILYIEPFTVEQAREFIDLKVGKPIALQQHYREVRDHIINSIDGFFKNESEIAHSDSRAFIGYAPVLLSISVLLKERGNYHDLLNALKKQSDKNIKLVLDIVNMILIRDKNQKVLPVVKERLLQGRSSIFCENVVASAYSQQEQCARILCHLLNEDPNIKLTGDTGFNLQYNDLVKSFQVEHPFIQDGKLQNVVFESYVVATLMLMPTYEKLVLKYLQTKYKNNFMLFFIYDKLCHDRKINPKFLPYLYASLKSLDDKNNYYGMMVANTEEDLTANAKIICDVEFYTLKDGLVSSMFTTTLSVGEKLVFGGTISNIEIVAPISVGFHSKKLAFAPPVMISCNDIVVNTAEFVIEEKTDFENITIEAENYTVDYSSNQIPRIVNFGNDNTKMQIFSGNKPDFPFSDYHYDKDEEVGSENGNYYSSLNEKDQEKYLRLRTILMQFRSHSKGELAKLKDKIEHNRVVKNEEGRKVLAKLIDKGVFFIEKHLYKINVDTKDEHIGLSYMELKRKIVNNKTVDFIKSI